MPASPAPPTISILIPTPPFLPRLSFVSGAGPGGITIGGGATTTGISAITAAGPNNAANVWNRRNLFTWADDFRINKGIHEISAGVWFQRLQDNENTASRQLGAGHFHQSDDFSAGNGEYLSGGAQSQ